MPVTRPPSRSAGATWRNTMQREADARQRAASRNCQVPRRCPVRGVPETSTERKAGTQVTSAPCSKKRVPRAEAPARDQTGGSGSVEVAACACHVTNATSANKASNAYLVKNHEDVENTNASAAVTSDALADSALKKSEDLLRELAALDLAEKLLGEQDNHVQSVEELDSEYNHVHSAEELDTECAPRRKRETIEIPLELFDMLVESWKKYHSTLGSIEDRQANNDDNIKLRRSPSPDSGRSSGSTTLDDTSSELGSVSDSVASPASVLSMPCDESFVQSFLGNAQRPTASSTIADIVQSPSSIAGTLCGGISTPRARCSTPRPTQPPTKALQMQSASVHRPRRVLAPNTRATSKSISQVKCITLRQTIGIKNTVQIYTAC